MGDDATCLGHAPSGRELWVVERTGLAEEAKDCVSREAQGWLPGGT